MGELLVIISEKNDIVYRQMYKKASDEEYCRLIVLIYGSIDILIEKMMSTEANYFDCLDEYGDMKISASVMSSGYKILFIHSRKSAKSFLDDIRCLFATVLVTQPLENKVLDDQVLYNEMEGIYSRHF